MAITVAEVMTRELATVSADSPISEYVGRGLLAGKVVTFGQQVPIGRAADPAPTGGEIHPS